MPSLQADIFDGSHTVRSLRFNNDFVAASYYGGEICLWSIANAELVGLKRAQKIYDFI